MNQYKKVVPRLHGKDTVFKKAFFFSKNDCKILLKIIFRLRKKNTKN